MTPIEKIPSGLLGLMVLLVAPPFLLFWLWLTLFVAGAVAGEWKILVMVIRGSA